MSFWSTAVKDEKWVVAEIAKGWETGAADIKGLFDYIAAHQTQIDTVASAILSNVSFVAALAGHPEVGAAATAITVSAKAIADLAANVDNKTPMSLQDVVSALHTVKDAQSAVNDLVKAATAKPVTVVLPPAAPATPPPVVS